MSGAGLIELLAARLGGRGARRSAPALREVLASAMPNRAPVTAYEPIASRLDDPMAEGAMLSGADDMAPPMPNAIRTGPDAGPVQNLDDGAMTALRRELRDHEFDVPSVMPTLPEIEVPIGNLRQGQIGSLDRADARRYASMNTEAPPILVRRDRSGWHIIDGNRRAAAAHMRGDGTVRAIDATDLFRTAPDGRPVQAGRIPSSMRIEIQQPPGQSGSRYRLELDNQKNGFITVTDDGDVWRVNNSHLDPDLRNQGHGVRLYEDLVLRAREAGARTLRSDNSVSTEAQNAWMGLQRRGYPVTRIETPDGPRFEVDLARTGPNAGSDRNALQRALRDRMNRE